MFWIKKPYFKKGRMGVTRLANSVRGGGAGPSTRKKGEIS